VASPVSTRSSESFQSGPAMLFLDRFDTSSPSPNRRICLFFSIYKPRTAASQVVRRTVAFVATSFFPVLDSLLL